MRPDPHVFFESWRGLAMNKAVLLPYKLIWETDVLSCMLSKVFYFRLMLYSLKGVTFTWLCGTLQALEFCLGRSVLFSWAVITATPNGSNQGRIMTPRGLARICILSRHADSLWTMLCVSLQPHLRNDCCILHVNVFYFCFIFSEYRVCYVYVIMSYTESSSLWPWKERLV